MAEGVVVMGVGTFAYKLFLLLHLVAVIVGFGSSFMYPMLAVKARALGRRDAYALNHATYSIERPLSLYPIYASGALGIVLVIISDEAWKFSQTWISVAFLLFILTVLVAVFLHLPNLKAMDALEGELAAAEGSVEPPKQVAEYEERSSKKSMYGGVLHLLWFLLMIDMIWKPGLGI
jgi:Predicted integral membrane protein (DUF2269)